MQKIAGHDNLLRWLDAIGANHVIVVSPHLDDAVLSLAGLLRAAGSRATVLTVFTESSPHQGLEWARMAGFADAVEEHAARRQEDRNALHYLGCGLHHAGLRSGELTPAAVAALLQEATGSSSTGNASGISPQKPLFLLPAGCGGHEVESGFSRLKRRLLRTPFGSMAHPEHEQVRDGFWASLAVQAFRVGFYAELPYAWRQTDRIIGTALEALASQPLQMVHIVPDTGDKLTAALHYRSQTNLILGNDPDYQRKVLSRPETLFVVDRSRLIP